MQLLQKLSQRISQYRQVARWWLVGVVFTLLNIPILYVLVDAFQIPLTMATILAGEAGLLARFLVNDRWVFEQQRPTWGRLWQYHMAVAGGFVIWWTATNLLSRLGLHYLLAALAATGFSVCASMITNFLWVWRRPVPPSSSAPAQ